MSNFESEKSEFDCPGQQSVKTGSTEITAGQAGFVAEPGNNSRITTTMLPPPSVKPTGYLPEKISAHPPLPDFEAEIPAVCDATRSKIEQQGIQPAAPALPENTMICCTRINFLLEKPLSRTLPPFIRKRWKDNQIDPKEFPVLRRTMAVAGITFIGDILEMDESQLHNTLEIKDFNDEAIASANDFLLLISKIFGIGYGKKINGTEKQHFENVKKFATEETDSVNPKLLVIPLKSLLKKIKPARFRKIMEHKLQEIDCAFVGDFIELSISDLQNCGFLDNCTPVTTILIEAIQKMGLKMSTRLNASTKTSLQLYRADYHEKRQTVKTLESL